jgi:hypothetical protein
VKEGTLGSWPRDRIVEHVIDGSSWSMEEEEEEEGKEEEKRKKALRNA